MTKPLISDAEKARRRKNAWKLPILAGVFCLVIGATKPMIIADSWFIAAAALFVLGIAIRPR